MELADLGFTHEELQQRVVDQLCEQFMTRLRFHPDDEHFEGPTRFNDAMMEKIKERIDSTIEALAEEHLLPNVTKYVEEIQLQATTKWGEKKGEPVSFIEYLIQRAEEYMTEEVNFEGKPKSNAGYGQWKGTQTRVMHLVDRHLHYSVERAMKEALATANETIVGGLEEAVRVKLSEVAKGVKVTVKT